MALEVQSAAGPGDAAGRFDQFLGALQRGDAAAQRQLFKTYWGPAYRQARRTLRHEGDAYDVTAGLFVDFLERYAERFRGSRPAALQAYLNTAAAHRAIKLKQWRERHAELGDDLVRRTEAEPMIAPRRLEECLRQLPARARQILTLHFGHDRDNREISDTLGISRSAVSKHLRHPEKGALARLRRCLDLPEEPIQ